MGHLECSPGRTKWTCYDLATRSRKDQESEKRLPIGKCNQGRLAGLSV